MKKQIAICLMASMLVTFIGPVLATAQDDDDDNPTSTDATSTSVTTVLTPQLGGEVSGEIGILAKWEMQGPCFGNGGSYTACTESGNEGMDDDDDAGTQFAAPGEWGENLDYTICAVVHGPKDNIANIKHVITEIFYPNVPVHTSDSNITCSGNGMANADGDDIDNPDGGCGTMVEQNFLTKLDQSVGKKLVCDSIRKGGNSNLINTWADDASYDSLCNSTTGELVKGKAAVYCVDKDLVWEDPAGDYKVDVWAIDENDDQSEVMSNTFNYQETKGFDIDFTSVDYGQVKIGDHKRIFGDKCFGTSEETVRNLGNVSLGMKIAQDDMDLGYQTDSTNWNVEYDARVGDLDTDWAVYEPFGKKGAQPNLTTDFTDLRETLDPSEIEEMDFSILVKEKWPQLSSHNTYNGTMWIGATTQNAESCI